MAPAFQRLTDNFLAHSLAVRVCIEEVDAGVNRAFYDLDRCSLAGLSTESSASQTQGADLHAGPAECAVFHLRNPLSRYSTAPSHRD